MLTATEEPTEESENYFISMTDMMVGMLFIFLIMLMVFALNYRIGDDDLKARERLSGRAAAAQREA